MCPMTLARRRARHSRWPCHAVVPASVPRLVLEHPSHTCPTGDRPSAVDQRLDDDDVEDLQSEDRDDRAEVEPPERRQDAAEDAQVRFDDVAQEPQHRIERARVRRPQARGEKQLHDDIKEDQQRVHVDHRREVVGDLRARAREHEGRAHRPPPSTASSASLKAVRRPARSSAAMPRAVTPPGEVTSRRTATVSYPRRRKSSAVPASVCTTSSAPSAAGIPRRTPASICASATSATYAGAHDISPIATSTSESSSTTSVPSSEQSSRTLRSRGGAAGAAGLRTTAPSSHS